MRKFCLVETESEFMARKGIVENKGLEKSEEIGEIDNSSIELLIRRFCTVETESEFMARKDIVEREENEEWERKIIEMSEEDRKTSEEMRRSRNIGKLEKQIIRMAEEDKKTSEVIKEAVESNDRELLVEKFYKIDTESEFMERNDIVKIEEDKETSEMFEEAVDSNDIEALTVDKLEEGGDIESLIWKFCRVERESETMGETGEEIEEIVRNINEVDLKEVRETEPIGDYGRIKIEDRSIEEEVEIKVHYGSMSESGDEDRDMFNDEDLECFLKKIHIITKR